MCLFSAKRKTRNQMLALEYKQEASLFIALSCLHTYLPSWSFSKLPSYSFCFLTFYYSHSVCRSFWPGLFPSHKLLIRRHSHGYIQDYCQHVRFVLFSFCIGCLSFFPGRFTNSLVRFISRLSCLYSRAFVTQTWGYHASVTSVLIGAATLVSKGGTPDSQTAWRISFRRTQLRRRSWYNVITVPTAATFILGVYIFQLSFYEKCTFNLRLLPSEKSAVWCGSQSNRKNNIENYWGTNMMVRKNPFKRQK